MGAQGPTDMSPLAAQYAAVGRGFGGAAAKAGGERG
jgi:hypothetical protein